MDLAGPSFAHDGGVRRRDVPDVRGEAVAGVERVGHVHVAVARHLRDDRGRRDRRALRVAVDDRAVRRRRRPEAEAVDERDVGRLAPPERLAQPAQVAPVQAVGDVNRAKLYYLRGRVGKKARVREKRYGHGSAADIAAQEAAAETTLEATEDEPAATEAGDLPGEEPSEAAGEVSVEAAEEPGEVEADEPQPSDSGEPVEDEPAEEPVPARE